MNLTEKEQADKLRRLARLRTPKRYPYIGDIVEVQKTDFKNDDLKGVPHLGICTQYYKGWCYVAGLERVEGRLILNKSLDFYSDEERHGKSVAIWRIRDDLAANPIDTPKETTP